MGSVSFTDIPFDIRFEIIHRAYQFDLEKYDIHALTDSAGYILVMSLSTFAIYASFMECTTISKDVYTYVRSAEYLNILCRKSAPYVQHTGILVKCYMAKDQDVYTVKGIFMASLINEFIPCTILDRNFLFQTCPYVYMQNVSTNCAKWGNIHTLTLHNVTLLGSLTFINVRRLTLIESRYQHMFRYTNFPAITELFVIHTPNLNLSYLSNSMTLRYLELHNSINVDDYVMLRQIDRLRIYIDDTNRALYFLSFGDKKRIVYKTYKTLTSTANKLITYNNLREVYINICNERYSFIRGRNPEVITHGTISTSSRHAMLAAAS
jgi:hypothetical protein